MGEGDAMHPAGGGCQLPLRRVEVISVPFEARI
jgi:hypothetical protein